MGPRAVQWSVGRASNPVVDAQYRITDDAGIEVLTQPRSVSGDPEAPSILVRVDVETATLLTHCTSSLPEWEVEHIVLDDFLPKMLAHEGALVLHAAGVLCGGLGLVILGDSGRGKSTLTAFLGQSGLPILSDDCLIVGADAQGHHVAPTYSGMRLLPDSISSIFAQPPVTTDMARWSTKQRVHLTCGFATDPAPVGALVFLDPPATGQAVTLRPMAKAETCIGLVANSFALDPRDTARATVRMRQAAALAQDAPAYALSYPRDYACLPDVAAAILDIMAQVGA